MKILYAVQATGNGHITRARAMLPALQQSGIEVDFLFSGRERNRLFDMQCFGDFRHYQGFTFITQEGRVNSFKTLRHARVGRFLKDVNVLDLSGYDLLLNDFEPVSAWAAKRQKIPSLGLAHQYALRYQLPGTQKAFWLKSAIDFFTPLDRYLGVHWQAFDQTILPPLLSLTGEQPTGSLPANEKFVLVYLPFESTTRVIDWLSSIQHCHFTVYADVPEPARHGHVNIRPLCREAFPADLKRCQGVICNTGFGLCSEALLLGKKILTKPLAGQIEQFSNACILQQMNRAWVMRDFDSKALVDWLDTEAQAPVHYPNVAQKVASWLVSGNDFEAKNLVKETWQEVQSFF